MSVMSKLRYAYFRMFDNAYEWAKQYDVVHGILRAKMRDIDDLNWIVIYERNYDEDLTQRNDKDASQSTTTT